MMLQRMSYFLGLMLIPTVLYAMYPSEECVPAKKPDLNNDGIVDYKDLWKVGRSFRLPKTDYRFIAKADTNCDGQIDNLDWSYVLRAYNKVYPIFPEVRGNIGINVPEKLYLGGEADFKGFMYMSSFKSPFTIKLTLQITPADGLSVKTNLPNQVVKVGQNQAVTMSHYYTWDQKFSFHLKAEKVGTYQFIIRAEIPEDEKVIEEIKTIQVLPSKKADLNTTLSVMQYPSVVYHEESAEYWLDVNITLTGKDVADIEKIELIDENTGKSRSVTERLSSGRGSVNIEVDRAFMQNQQCKSFHVHITTPYDSITSKTVKYCATAIKPEPEPPKLPYPPDPNIECVLCY
jgi:hypothetical protein